MATNKRKDAAALFELIDKSTLKVPKAGGNLKIPSWWSDKTNPSNKETPAHGAAAAGPAAPATGGVVVEDAPEAAPAERAEPQARLFEPPPAHVTPSSSPSIRPPKAPLAAVMAEPVKVSSLESGASAPATASKTAPLPGTSPTTLGSASSVRPTRAAGATGAASTGGASAHQVLMPPTMDPGRKTWAPPRPRTGSRVPWWAVGTLGVVVVLVLTVVAAVMIGKSGRKAPTTQAAAQVRDGGSVARSKDQYYIVVYATPAGTLKPADSPAYKHAKFLADRGEDVSIERVDMPVSGGRGRTESWYWVVSVKGFASATEAKPYRDQIVKIGDQMTPGVWKGAYALSGLSQTGATGPAVPR